MEDHEAQELEFWRKLEESEMSRSQMLKRSVAAAAGLTVLGTGGSALAGIRAAGANPPLKGKSITMKELIAEAKKEGHINTIALPPDWANYGEIMSTFTKKYGLGITNDNPDGSSAQENQAITSLKGDSRAPDVVDVGPSFAVSGAASGLYGKYFPTTFSTIPRAMKDTRGYWYGDYWGAISIGYNQNLISNPPTTWKDLLKPEYKGKVAMNGSPLTSNSAVSGVLAASIANGGSVANVGPGIDFFATMKKSGNFIPVQTTSSTVASGQTPISIDWDYNNLAYVSEFPAARWKVTIPADGVYGGYYAQAINASAPHPWTARLWEEFIYSDQGQLLYLKGFAHPARFNDLANRKKIPASLLSALPSPALYAKAKFASLGQQTTAKATIATDWPAKVGA
ncbi:MAG TPA: ABC transporter substrate-binding protein [Gaiellaceae bacterium]|jgi:putative spermidine/putrescine transport system substrate-binding protein|nr:ABC transporter substrate-binding protein [Gaiellaceae bacterium]